MDEDESLCKVETKDGDIYLFTKRLAKDEVGFNLSITDGSSVWEAKVTKDMLEDMAQKVEMNITQYVTQTFNALTACTSGTDMFIYQADRNDSTLEFIWKKQLDDGVKFQLGEISLSLSEENKDLMKTILDFSIRRIHEYKDAMTNMKCEKEQLARDRENAILRLDKCIAGKEEMEVDLFQKFVTVLNDKKAKIRRLQETIEMKSKEQNMVRDSNTVTNTADDHATNYQNRDGDNDTDVEMDDSQAEKNHTKEKATTSSNIGSCLLQDEEDAAPVIKRRRKQPSRQPTRTPSKSVLPEVKTTVRRTTSSASNTSTTSNKSKQSSGSTRRSRRNKGSSTFPDDVEDLFGDMA